MRQPVKRRALFQAIRPHNIDICLLQETHSTIHDQKIWSSEWGGKILFSHGRSNARGVAVLIAPGFDLNVTLTHNDNDGRLLIIKVMSEVDSATIANIYAPTQSEPRAQEAFMSACENVLSGIDIQNLWMGGDFITHFPPPI